VIPFVIGIGAIIGAIGLNRTANRMADIALRSLEGEPEYITTGPSVSVVVPTLQEEDYVENLLRSVRNQTYAPIEVVISDSSPDEHKTAIKGIAERWGAALVFSPQLNVSIGRNEGARAAHGDILVICDADCVMAPDYIERLVEHIKNGAVLAHGVDTYYDSGGVRPAIRIAKQYVFKGLADTTGRGVAVRADAFWEVGGYDESLDPYKNSDREDLDFGRRIAGKYGRDAIVLDREAIIAEADRRPQKLTNVMNLWPERGWRSGVPIERRLESGRR